MDISYCQILLFIISTIVQKQVIYTMLFYPRIDPFIFERFFIVKYNNLVIRFIYYFKGYIIITILLQFLLLKMLYICVQEVCKGITKIKLLEK